jgi:hypothetical protein
MNGGVGRAAGIVLMFLMLLLLIGVVLAVAA